MDDGEVRSTEEEKCVYKNVPKILNTSIEDLGESHLHAPVGLCSAGNYDTVDSDNSPYVGMYASPYGIAYMLQIDFPIENCEPRQILILKICLIFRRKSIGTRLDWEFCRDNYQNFSKIGIYFSRKRVSTLEIYQSFMP